MQTIVFNTGRKYAAEGQVIVATLHDDGVVTFFDHSRGVDGEYKLDMAFLFSAENVMKNYDSGNAKNTQRSWKDGMMRDGCNTRAAASLIAARGAAEDAKPKADPVAKRQQIEKRIVKQIVDTALAAGCLITVCDGEDYPVKRSTDAKAIMAAIMSTDEDVLIIRKADGTKLGSVYLAYGNDGYDVISDYVDTPEMAPLLAPAKALADKIEERA
jgi:hypothetical protein